LKFDQQLNQTATFKLYPYINLPKEVLSTQRHELDRLHVWAAFLAHPYLDLPEKNVTLKQQELDTIYLLLEDNKVLLHLLNYCLSSKHYSPEKKRTIWKLIERHKSFAETYEFAISLKQEILKIMKTLRNKGVETIFIKSLTEIPLDSSNFDILVKKQQILKAKRILEDLGFTELTRIREYEWGGPPHKFLFRKFYNGIVMSIHLHTQVAWEGIKFSDEKKLWNRIKKRRIDGVALGFPSPEDHLLITIAHAFFENKCLKLSDLICMVEDFQHISKMDWDYIVDHTINDGWFEPFYAFLRLADHIHKSLFGRKLIEADIFRYVRARNGQLHKAVSLEKQLIDSFEKEPFLPFKISNSIIIMAFIKKVFATPNFSFIKKSEKILSTSWSYVKKRLKRKKSASLVCFSGQDGTGKTNHSKSLQRELAQRKIKTVYIWSRGIGYFIEPLLRLGRLFLFSSKFSKSSEYVAKRKNLLKREPIKTLWTYATLTDEILLTFFKVRISLLRGRVIICDRYILDILVDLKCELDKDISGIIQEFIKKLIPTPKIHFVLYAKPEEIMKRKRDLSLELVKCKSYHYLVYPYREKLTPINTGKSLERNREDILTGFMKARYLGKNY
jgi:thymidylate kinase